MMKIILCLLLSLTLVGCSNNQETNVEPVAPTMINLPAKEDPNNNLGSASPIKADNLDEYLFRDDCVYIDTRDAYQFYAEGHVAGFTNIPLYGYITDFKYNPETLFSIETAKESDKVIHFGDIGSFVPNYEESTKLIEDLIPHDKNILVISTAGVESAYFLNLLVQLGYDSNKLYNVGSFTNGMGSDVAYLTYEGARYLIEGIEMFDTTIDYKLNVANYHPLVK